MEDEHITGRNKNLIWEDDFNYMGSPDPEKWAFETKVWRNKEEQVYTPSLQNARVEEGHLCIEAHRQEIKCPVEEGRIGEYSSASLCSKEAWLYGRIEVRAKLPKGRGVWPAIWMMPQEMTNNWPDCGEIDIMENVGWDPQTIHASVHTAVFNHIKKTHKTGTVELEDPWNEFHTYAVKWSAEKMEFFVDEISIFKYQDHSQGADSWPFTRPFYLKLNIAVGGGWGSVKGIDEKIFPQRMIIDSVKVFAN